MIKLRMKDNNEGEMGHCRSEAAELAGGTDTRGGQKPSAAGLKRGVNKGIPEQDPSLLY